MFGIRLIIILAIVGGLIAYLGDWLGTKIGKGRMSLFGLRPRYTSILVAVFTGVAIAVFTVAMMAASSEEARVALFGVKSLQKQAADLKLETEQQNLEIEKTHEILNQRQKELKKAQDELKLVENELQNNLLRVQSMQGEVDQLQAIRNQLESQRTALENRVQYLGEAAEALEKNISNLREGNILVRAGQVLRTGVFAGNQPKETTQVNLNSFMEQTNQELTEEYQGKLGGTQGLLMSQQSFEDTVTFLNQNKGIYAVRVLSAGNLFAGEPLMVTFDVFPNLIVYNTGDVIHQEMINVSEDPAELESQVMKFLRQVNEKAVEKGVKPDPVRGTVGAISISDIYGTVNQLKGHQGKVLLIAKAKQNIYTPGPVRVDIQIRESLL